MKTGPKAKITTNSTKDTSPTSRSHKCFSFQGLGHIACECPNQKIVSFVQENFEEKPEDEDPLKEEDHKDEAEITYGDEREVVIDHSYDISRIIEVINLSKLNVDSVFFEQRDNFRCF